MKRLFFPVVLAVALSGCISRIDGSADEQFKTLACGTLTKREVVTALGNPDEILENGSVWRYVTRRGIGSEFSITWAAFHFLSVGNLRSDLYKHELRFEGDTLAEVSAFSTAEKAYHYQVLPR